MATDTDTSVSEPNFGSPTVLRSDSDSSTGVTDSPARLGMPFVVFVAHPFHAEEVDEISLLVVGDPILVTEKDDQYNDGWWRGVNIKGDSGLFPSNFAAASNFRHWEINDVASKFKMSQVLRIGDPSDGGVTYKLPQPPVPFRSSAPAMAKDTSASAPFPAASAISNNSALTMSPSAQVDIATTHYSSATHFSDSPQQNPKDNTNTDALSLEISKEGVAEKEPTGVVSKSLSLESRTPTGVSMSDVKGNVDNIDGLPEPKILAALEQWSSEEVSTWMGAAGYKRESAVFSGKYSLLPLQDESDKFHVF